MFESLFLVNFQPHQKISLQLDSITTIAGVSDSGKSSLVRSLLWITLNKSKGNIITWEKTFTKGILKVDGHTITRKRSKKVNLYKLDDSVFHFDSSDRRGVPPPISDLLNITEDNIQRQRDLHFWLAETPGNLSKLLNSVVDLSVMDSSLSHISSEINKTKIKGELISSELESSRKEMDELSWVKEFDRDLVVLEGTQTEIEKLALKRELMAVCIQDGQNYEKTIGRALVSILDARKCIEIGMKTQQTEKQYQNLSSLIDSLEKAEKLINTEIPDLSQLEELLSTYTDLSSQLDELATLINQIEEGERQICHLKKSEQRALEEWERKTKGKTCPICLRPWGK